MVISTGDYSKFWPCLVAQMLGAIVGAVLAWLHFSPHWRETEDPNTKLLCFSTMSAIWSIGANLASEIIGTFVLVMAAAAIFSKKVAVGGPAAALVLLDHKMMPFESLAEPEHILNRYDAKTS
jgi:glycerol uptake facilitator-like aquaporin